MQSGLAPYEYATRGGRFRVPNPYFGDTPIGPSGILLEQAQFLIVAERRKWNKFLATGSHFLPDFNVYVSPVITPSGPYEPKVTGTTLANLINPGALNILDIIQETRLALNGLFGDYEDETDLDRHEYRAAWLQSLYPESASGRYLADDPDHGNTVIGHWSHRFPSETGYIDYLSPEVLGSSGVLYDIDFAEVMFNPPPHITRVAFDTMHGRNTNNSEDTFNVQQQPLFPAFQRLDGSLVGLTGREPDFLRQHTNYSIAHISSGVIRIDGYVISSGTSFYLGRNGQFFDTSSEDFNPFSQGLREVSFGGNMADARLFALPTPQLSGIYRIAAINKFADFPNTTIESGIMSFWPKLDRYWPSGIGVDATKVGSTTTQANLGYHVFDDSIWCTDVAANSSFGGPNFGYPSGLAIMSPYTGHRLWVRYADQQQFISTVSFGAITVQPSSNWSKAVGLTRSVSDNIYRLHNTIQRTFTSASGQARLGLYNDMLDFTTDVTSTSDVTEPNTANQFPVADAGLFSDMWYDPSASQYWIVNGDTVGFAFWRFDSSFKYLNKYITPVNSGMINPRGVTIGGQQYFFDDGNAGVALNSGIFPSTIVEGTAPYDNTGNIPEVGTVSYGIMKNINGAPFIGYADGGNIMDILQISGNTHVQDGIYAIVRWHKPSDGPFSGGSLYLVRIEEGSNYWEVMSISRLETGVGTAMNRREILAMPY